jgi:hypothetical protein
MPQENLNFETKAANPVEGLGQTFRGKKRPRERFLKLAAEKLAIAPNFLPRISPNPGCFSPRRHTEP